VSKTPAPHKAPSAEGARPATHFKAAVSIPSPAQLYEKYNKEIVAAPSGGRVLLNYLLRVLQEVFQKMRLAKLEEVSLGHTSARHELITSLTSLLTRFKRGEMEATMRFSFEMSNDPGRHKRTVIIDLSRESGRVTVIGVEPKDGIDGFLREKGGYAKERQARRKVSGRVDHYITGAFAQTSRDELLATIDNTLVAGEPGIDVRGSVVKPKPAVKYYLELGEGVEKREKSPGKIEIYATGAGVVKTRYDEGDNLRFLGVATAVKLGEVGFRAGGHVMARGEKGKGAALSIETAEFRSVPIAFEARTEGAIYVKETVQGKVYGAEITAEMVNQAPGKFMVATAGAITVNRSLQGGFLYAPKIVIGNGRVVATLMNAHLQARNRFLGRNIMLAGRSRLILGNDFFKEEQAAAGATSCAISGQDLFANRGELKFARLEKEAELKDHNEAISRTLLGQVQKTLVARPATDKAVLRRVLETVNLLEKQFADCSLSEEEEMRRKIANLLFEIGLEDSMPFIKHLGRKKALLAEIGQLDAQLAAITQEIQAELHLADCKDGAMLTIRCWQDELLLRCLEHELLLERPAAKEQIFSGPRRSRAITFAFNYDTDLLDCQVTA